MECYNNPVFKRNEGVNYKYGMTYCDKTSDTVADYLLYGKVYQQDSYINIDHNFVWNTL